MHYPKVVPLVWWRGCLVTRPALDRIAQMTPEQRDQLAALAGPGHRVLTDEDVQTGS